MGHRVPLTEGNQIRDRVMGKREPFSSDSSTAGIFTELQHPSLCQELVEGIHFAIISGKLKPGQRITEGQICRMTGVSRTSVREAFQQLLSLGVLRESRRKRYVSSEPSADEIRDIYTFRGLCEGLAVEQAKKNLKKSDLAVLSKNIREMEWASRKKDLEAFRKADLAFHERIWRANGKEYLLRVCRAITEPYHFFFMAILHKASRKELLDMTRLHREQFEDLGRPGTNKLKSRTEQRYRAMGKQFLKLYRKYTK